MVELLQLVGGFGLVLLATGVITHERGKQDILYIVGGICLAAYSLYIGDLIFIVLQIVFIIVAGYDFVKNRAR